jgi:hypothetical protein
MILLPPRFRGAVQILIAVRRRDVKVGVAASADALCGNSGTEYRSASRR